MVADIELLSPAGDPEKLQMAVAYGADAVYLAGSEFGMRRGAGNFDNDGLEKAVTLCHANGVRAYVTCNTVPRNYEIDRLPAYLEYLNDLRCDGLIIADVGVMGIAKRYAPDLPVHVSTQTGVANYVTAQTLYDMGADTAVLARELTLDEVAGIRAKTSKELKLEAFVHGAMCVSFSGRCLLSNYLTGRDANRGACAQPCRWKYYLTEEKRPGQYLEITEDGGTYIMNSRDLRMIEHIPDLHRAGVYSFKIEGRAKSSYYAAATTNAYRHAIDGYLAGEAFDPVWLEETNLVSHREYSTGFYFDKDGPGQYYGSAMYFNDCDVAAVVESCDNDGNAVLIQRNKICTGDRLSLLQPQGKPQTFVAENMTDDEGNLIEATPHPTMRYRMKLPCCAVKDSFVRKMKE